MSHKHFATNGSRPASKRAPSSRGDAEKPSYTIATAENVLLFRSHFWPLADENVASVDLANLRAALVIPYTVYNDDLLPAMGKFLARLLLTPRFEVASYKESIFEPFVGKPMPLDKAETRIADGAGLNHEAARELALIHMSTIRRVREQIMSGSANHTKPKLAHVPNEECPFGKTCLFETYATIIRRMIATYAGEQPISFIMTGTDQIYSMMKKKIVVDHCTCPYVHTDKDRDHIRNNFSDNIFAALIGEFPNHIWPIINGYSVTTRRNNSSMPCDYDIRSVRAAADSKPDTMAALVSVVALASLDNVCDRQMFLPVPSNVFALLAQNVQKEYDAFMLRPSSDERPYLDYFKAIPILLGLRPKRAPVSDVTKLGAEYNENMKAISKEIADVERQTREAEETAKANALAKIEAMKTKKLLAEKKLIEALNGPEELPSTAPSAIGQHRPIHGLKYIPRIVTDEFLEKHGFSFQTYHKKTTEERMLYIVESLRKIYITFLPTLAENEMRDLITWVLSQAQGDPYRLFDEGHAYLPLYR